MATQIATSPNPYDESQGVAGRVGSLTAQGSPLMTAARTRAKQSMSRSGLQNSSLAGQAAEQAVIETATPIATADAQLFQQQQIENQRNATQVSLANASLAEQGRQFDASQKWDQERFGSTLMEQRRQFDVGTGLEGRKLDLNASQFRDTLGFQREQLSQQGRQFDISTSLEGRKLDLNDKQFIANLGQQDRQFVQNLQLQRDNLAAQREQFAQRLGLDVAQLDLAKNQMSQQDRQFLADLGLKAQQLEQQAGQFTQNLSEQRRQFDTQAGQQDAQFAQRLSLERDNLAAQREQFAQRLGLDVQQLELSRNQLSQQDRQFLAELDQKQQQLAQQESQFTREQVNRVTLANLDATNRKELMQLEAGYKQDIAGNENISRAWGSMMDSITQIQNNPELDQAAKATMIQNTQNSFAAFANFWKKSTGGKVDVGDLLNFGQIGGSGGNGGGGGQDSDSQYMPEGWQPRGRDQVSAGYTYDEAAGRWRKPG